MTNQSKSVMDSVASEWLAARDIIAAVFMDHANFHKTRCEELAGAVLVRLANAGILTIRAEDYPESLVCQCCGNPYFSKHVDSVRCPDCCSTCYFDRKANKWLAGCLCPKKKKPESRDDKEQACLDSMREFNAVVAAERKGR